MLIHVDAAQSCGRTKNQAEVLLRVQESTRLCSHMAGEVFESLKIDMFRMRSGPCWPRWFAFFGMSGDRAVVDPQPAALLAEQFTRSDTVSPSSEMTEKRGKRRRWRRGAYSLFRLRAGAIWYPRGNWIWIAGVGGQGLHLLVRSWALTGASVTTFPGNSLSELVEKRET
ncbi:MAG: hypothetical protein DRO93_07735 [Candidatus Thorarchaeota archaeon]|nr:MAG: hypothetical protein DRO93_07735 [Candidatus Thorarchaeota archaeon]